MQIKPVDNLKFIHKSQNFKGNSETPSPQASSQEVQPAPLEASKAYASAQITEGYREIETFDVPYVGQGKLYQLSNGHKVVIIPKPGPTIINTYVGVGNLNEPGNVKQMSHLMEHLLANNCSSPTKQETKEFIAKTGATYNAGTADFFTQYHITAPITNTEDLTKLIKIQSETIQNKDFTDKDIEDEKQIITRELGFRDFSTRPDLLADRISRKNLFKLKDSDDIVIPSSNTTINNITKDDLLNYYNTFYQPNNMVTAVVGAVDNNTIKTISKYFGAMQNSKDTKNTYPKIPTENFLEKTVRSDVISLDKESEKAFIDLSFIGPNSSDPDYIKLTALKYLINERIDKYPTDDKKDEEESSNKVVDRNEEKLDLSIFSETVSSDKKSPTMLRVQGESKNYYTERDLKAVYSILHDFTQNPVSDEELNKMKKKFDSFKTLGQEYADILSDEYALTVLMSENLDKNKSINVINSLSAQDIQETAKKYLDLNKASIAVIHPYKTPYDKVKKAKDVSFKGEINQFDSKDVHEYVLPNNLRVVIDSSPGIVNSTIKFNLHSKKNLYNNPIAGDILGSFMASRKTREHLKNENIIFIHGGDSQQMSTLMYGSSDKTLEMLGYAVGIPLYPKVSKNVFDEFKKIMVSEEENPFSEPESKDISQKFVDKLYGESPYTAYKKGYIKDLTIEDLKYYHKQLLDNAQGTVFITLPKEKLEQVQGEIFETLMKVPTLQPYDYKTVFNKVAFEPLKKTEVLVKGNESPQIGIRQYFKIIESGNIKDRAGLQILNEILGGSPKSLLHEHLRDKDKITYSAGSSYGYNIDTGKLSELTLGTNVTGNTENLHKVIEEYTNCTNELITKPVSKEALEEAKIRLKSSIIYDTESSIGKNATVSSGYGSFYGASYQDELLTAIDEMTPEYVQALAKHYLTQPSLFTVVGNKKVIEENKEYLSKLGQVVDCT